MAVDLPPAYLIKKLYHCTLSHTDSDLMFVFSVADYVFFENSSSNPYLIRRIEELNKVLRCLCLSFVSVYA